MENRLSVVTNTVTNAVTGEVTRFIYDGDGKRVLREDGSGVTVYLGAVEVHVTGTQRVTKTYYFAGSQRIAMSVSGSGGGELTYLHGDHLGSASLATDASGTLLNEMRYRPFGETRYGDVPTDRRFTGQREESSLGLGLYDYNARFYSAGLGRFLSADSIVPSPGNPQSFNRYAYVLNNPLRYTDPSGHCSAGNEQFTLTLGDKCAYWVTDDVESAQEYLDAINAYLRIQEYEYDTTWEWVKEIAISEGIKKAAGKIAERLSVAPGVGKWIAKLTMSSQKQASGEALKTLRRFRDDLQSTIDFWRDNPDRENARLTIQMVRRIIEQDVYAITLSEYIEYPRYIPNGGWGHTEELAYYRHDTGGPLWGTVNSFGKLAIELTIDFVTCPEISGTVYVRKGWQRRPATPYGPE